MYLTKRKYIWSDERSKLKITGLKEKIDGSKVKELAFDAGYWRKANAIHKWFEDNCAGDDWHGGDVYVSKKDMQTLLNLCKEVVAKAKVVKGKVQNNSTLTPDGWQPIMEDGEYIENAEEIAKILPTTDGFFFGSTDYDQWYLKDIKDTIEILEKAIADPDSGEYYYSASW